MKRSTLTRWIGITALAMAAVVATAPSSWAMGSQVVVSGHAGVRVWVDGGDIFPSYGDVTIWLRADRDCYTTLFLVDTAGYLHVLYPSSPYDPSWIRGGRTYRYRGGDIGLERLDGVGIAHVFAVGSPVPFDYSTYGAAVFAGGFGFRVYGDPYVACRAFYASLLPAQCQWDYVGVSCARFYVREWVRYPAYLCCAVPGVHIRFGDSCRACSSLYVSYRHSVSDPDDAFRPAARFKSVYNDRNDNGRYAAGNAEATGRVERTASRTVKNESRGDVSRRPATVVTRSVATRVPARVVSTSRSKGTVAPRSSQVTITGKGRHSAVVFKTRAVESQSTRKTGRASSASEKGKSKQARQAE